MCAAQRYLFVWDFVIQVELPFPILKCYFPLRHGATEGKTVALLIPNAAVTSVSGCISEYHLTLSQSSWIPVTLLIRAVTNSTHVSFDAKNVSRQLQARSACRRQLLLAATVSKLLPFDVHVLLVL